METEWLLHIYREKQMPVWLAIIFHSQLLYFVITVCPYLMVTCRTASPWQSPVQPS